MKLEIGTPNNIDVLLHCYSMRAEHPRYGAPAVREAFDRFVELGVIEKNGGYYVTTDLGRAWVKALCNTQIPKSVYVDEYGTILSENANIPSRHTGGQIILKTNK